MFLQRSDAEQLLLVVFFSIETCEGLHRQEAPLVAIDPHRHSSLLLCTSVDFFGATSMSATSSVVGKPPDFQVPSLVCLASDALLVVTSYLADLDVVHVATTARTLLRALAAYPIRKYLHYPDAFRLSASLHRVGIVRRLRFIELGAELTTTGGRIPPSVREIQTWNWKGLTLPLLQSVLVSGVRSFRLVDWGRARHVPLHFSEGESLQDLHLPNSLTELDVPLFYYPQTKTVADLSEMQLPPNLTYLTLPFIGALRTSLRLPLNLREVGLRGWDREADCTRVSLPEGLQILRFSNDFNCRLDTLRLPTSLTALHFHDQSNLIHPLDPLSAQPWPHGLTALHLPQTYDCPLEHLQLPPALTELCLGDFFNQPMAAIRFPSTLTALSFDIEHSLVDLHLPSSLTFLRIGSAYRRSFGHPLPRSLPDALRLLEIGSVRSLFLNEVTSERSQPRQSLRTFGGLTELHVHEVDPGALQSIALPPSLVRLQIGFGHGVVPFGVCPSLAGVSWPPALTALEFATAEVDLRDWTPPPHLRTLQLCNLVHAPQLRRAVVLGGCRHVLGGPRAGPWPMHFPSHLHSLVIGDVFAVISLEPRVPWAATLTELTLVCAQLDMARVPPDCWPPALRTLELQISECERALSRSLPLLNLPGSVQHLSIVCPEAEIWVPASLLGPMLPRQLQTLMVQCADPSQQQQQQVSAIAASAAGSLSAVAVGCAPRPPPIPLLPSTLLSLTLGCVEQLHRDGWAQLIGPEAPTRVTILPSPRRRVPADIRCAFCT